MSISPDCNYRGDAVSITNKLNQIKNAIYGKEVRGAIHDAIKQVYDDASVNHDNANMEVKMARGTHNTLNDRLDNVDEIQAQTNAQLSEINNNKANKLEVYLKENGININDFDEETRRAILEAHEINVNYVLGDESVNPQNTTFFDIVVGKNKFNRDNCVLGHYVDYTSGVVRENAGYCYAKHEKIKGGTLYTMNLQAVQTCFYDSNKEYISGHLSSANSMSFTAPSNAKYFISSVPTDLINQFMIVEGTSIDGYEPYEKSERIPVKYLPQALELIGEVIIVDKNGNGDFATLTDAVNYAKNNDVIIVMSGVYENEVIRAWEKTLYIIGIDKNTTIIKNSTGDYRNPPLEMTSGLLKNLTIVAEKNPNGFDGTPAYAIHIENNFMENKTLEIENCHIVSHVNFAIGCGLRKGCLLEIKNSRLEGYSDLQGGLYVHDTDVDAMVGLQMLRVKNTEILSNSSNSSAQQLVLQSMHKNGAEFNVEFINTNIRNMTTGNQNYAFQDASDWKTYDRPELVPNISLSKASYGNSLNKLNYDF